MKKLLFASTLFFASTSRLLADNQTATVDPVHLQNKLPFKISIKKAGFQLPNGVHSGAVAQIDGKWLLLAGRTNGMHTFNNDNNNFPPQEQNKFVYVVDPVKQRVYSRSLTAAQSGLSQFQIDSLSVTAPQYHQHKGRLYITGGYGVDTDTGLFSTKPLLTAIDIKGMMDWVMHRTHHKAVHFIRQLGNEAFQVTGGDMFKIGKNPYLLVFGQNFPGFYLGSSNGIYTDQVRRFRIHDDGKKLKVKFLKSDPVQPDPRFRRRDLNIVPLVEKKHGKLHQSIVALSGVFTETDGAWTVPVEITANGKPHMQDPANVTAWPRAFKQGMNNYISATCGLFSSKRNEMYTLLFGGITFGFFQNGQFQTDSELPFTNQITALKREKSGKYKQYLMGEFPSIVSTGSNPGNTLLFGASAMFFPRHDLKRYSNEVFKYDSIEDKKLCIGYIVGGIQSTLANTQTATDSAASPYIFKVYISPHLH